MAIDKRRIGFIASTKGFTRCTDIRISNTIEIDRTETSFRAVHFNSSICHCGTSELWCLQSNVLRNRNKRADAAMDNYTSWGICRNRGEKSSRTEGVYLIWNRSIRSISGGPVMEGLSERDSFKKRRFQSSIGSSVTAEAFNWLVENFDWKNRRHI